MNLVSYSLDEVEKDRLINGIKSALAIPFIDSLEDFIWEGVFCYTKGIRITDYLLEKRKKLLFDVTSGSIGWSAKSLQWPNIEKDAEFELVIQRADIIKKRRALGFPTLTLDSDPAELGAALLSHWHKKIDDDSVIQKITDKRICVLLKSKDNIKYAYFEEELVRYSVEDLIWEWTNEERNSLKGIRKSDGFCVYKWYHNQKQFFERFQINEVAYMFDLQPKRLQMKEIVAFLTSRLEDK